MSFWLDNPSVLFSDLNILPNESQSRVERLNTLTRLVIFIAIVLYLLKVRGYDQLLVFGVLIIIILYYNQMNKEGFKQTNTFSESNGMWYSTERGPPKKEVFEPFYMPPHPADAAVWGGQHTQLNVPNPNLQHNDLDVSYLNLDVNPVEQPNVHTGFESYNYVYRGSSVSDPQKTQYRAMPLNNIPMGKYHGTNSPNIPPNPYSHLTSGNIQYYTRQIDPFSGPSFLYPSTVAHYDYVDERGNIRSHYERRGLTGDAYFDVIQEKQLADENMHRESMIEGIMNKMYQHSSEMAAHPTMPFHQTRRMR